MTVFKCFMDFKKEEQWLLEMARKGNRLIKAGNGYYKFIYDANIPDNYSIKTDYRTFSKDGDYNNYLSLFEDSGWRHIAGGKWAGNQYFERVSPDANDDIFSDSFSSAGRYKRYSYMWLSIAVAYLPLMVVYTQNWIVSPDKMFHFKELYLTPGLWDMKGAKFLLAFLFETPFALFRGYSSLIFFIIILLYAYCAIKSYRLYKKELKNITHQSVPNTKA